MKELDYEKEFISGNTTITRCDYEDMPVPMNTSSLSDDEMQRLAEAIEEEMERWQEWLDNGDVNQDQYDEAWWESMEHLGLAFGMTYYEDEDCDFDDESDSNNQNDDIYWEKFRKEVEMMVERNKLLYQDKLVWRKKSDKNLEN